MSTSREHGEDDRVRALRGATTVPSNDRSAIVTATEELLQVMLERNEATSEDLISVIFTATPDLDAEFPAVAARALGWEVPLLGAAEMGVPGAVPRCIRVLMHLYTTRDYASLRHVYLGEARSLRADLPD
jgi:chorismate mutase